MRGCQTHCDACAAPGSQTCSACQDFRCDCEVADALGSVLHLAARHAGAWQSCPVIVSLQARWYLHCIWRTVQGMARAFCQCEVADALGPVQHLARFAGHGTSPLSM